MSIITGFVSRKGIQILTDSKQLSLDGGPAVHASKALCIPHLHCAIASRGFSALLTFLYNELQQIGTAADDLEGIEGEIQGAAERAFHNLAQACGRHGWEADGGGGDLNSHELLIAGWGRASGRPVAKYFRPDGLAGLTMMAVPDGYFALPGANQSDMARITATMSNRRTADVLLDIARAQMNVDDRHRQMIGGHAVLTTIGPTGLEQRRVGTLSNL